ncbi:MAG: formate/nitrite transporter family protein [Bacilli bacterium]|nr:formate/nitrite transporter family protein [Bacilli bacterium]
MKYLKVLLFGIFAGLAIGLGSLAFTVVSAYLTDAMGLFLASALFSVGLILVCVLGLQLYTGKIGTVFDGEAKRDVINNAINLPIMLVGNTIGAFAIGIVCHFIFMNVPEVANRIAAIAQGKIDSNTVFIQGILCGALVYIAVYFYKNLQNYGMKIIGIITAVTLFVYCGFQHCVANMFYFGMDFSWKLEYLWNILIVILTNSIGALLVRCIVHLAAILASKKE